MKLLHLDSSILGENSASRAISAAVVAHFRAADSNIEVTSRDLVAEAQPNLTLEIFQSLDSGKDVAQFLAADIVVIGAGFYNFTIPGQLKSWIDRIVVRGKTFSYGETGPIGLAAGKRIIIALARGNIYHQGAPYASYEHAETLLRGIFGFIGVTDLEVVVAEGLGFGDDARRIAIDNALDHVNRIATT